MMYERMTEMSSYFKQNINWAESRSPKRPTSWGPRCPWFDPRPLKTKSLREYLWKLYCEVNLIEEFAQTTYTVVRIEVQF